MSYILNYLGASFNCLFYLGSYKKDTVLTPYCIAVLMPGFQFANRKPRFVGPEENSKLEPGKLPAIRIQ